MTGALGVLPARFVKMSGAGNDFLVFAERVAVGAREAAAIRRVCDRRTGVGADGVLFVHTEDTGDGPPRIVADYYNADGGASRFCANGTRCAARLARVKLHTPPELVVQTGWGAVGARVWADGRVTLELPESVTPGRTLATGLGNRKADAFGVFPVACRTRGFLEATARTSTTLTSARSARR